MIYYFSGTGNSLYIAKRLAEALGHKTCDMAQAATYSEDLDKGESIGFVFPIYAWGLPRVVEDFLRILKRPTHYHFTFAVMTCGDDVGYTDVLLKKELAKRNWELHAAYSIQMRNTYVCLPGFDVDNEQVARSKQVAMEKQLQHIMGQLAHHKRVYELTRGSMPWIKSYVLRPLFNLFLISDNRFKVNKELCVKCGKCVRLCPLHNIEMKKNDTIIWNGHCTHCLRCYHICPHHAINYGFFTHTKGQVKIFV